MTEIRFELIWETDEMCNVFDNDLDVNSTISVEDVVDLLNELHEQVEVCKEAYREIKEDAIRKAEENKALRKQLDSEHQMLENAILLERTRMGQSALKQFKESLR